MLFFYLNFLVKKQVEKVNKDKRNDIKQCKTKILFVFAFRTSNQLFSIISYGIDRLYNISVCF